MPTLLQQLRGTIRLHQTALTFSINPASHLLPEFPCSPFRARNKWCIREKEREMSFISCLWKKLKLLIRNHGTGSAPLPGRAPMVPWGALASCLFGLAPARRLPALLQMGTGGLRGNVTAPSPSRVAPPESLLPPAARDAPLCRRAAGPGCGLVERMRGARR